MLKINKQNISFTRGENINLDISIYDTDGQPFILPAIPSNLPDLVCMMAFTIRSGTYDDIVATKYLDITNSNIVINKVIDYSAKGFNKFSTQDITEVDTLDDVEDYFGYVVPIEAPTDEQIEHRYTVVKCKADNQYYFWVSPTIDPEDNNGVIGLYYFDINIPFLFNDTANLEAKEYIYDLIAYIGCKKTVEEDFPLETVYWKKELITPHKFVLEDSNNA